MISKDANTLLCSVLLAVLASTTTACAAAGRWELVRSMRDTFQGPDVGEAYGQLLLTGIDFADANRGVIGGFNDPSEIRHLTGAEGMLGRTADGGRTFQIQKARRHVWTVAHAGGKTYWAAGLVGALRSTNDGRTWKPVEGKGGGSRPCVQLFFRDADNGLLGVNSLVRVKDGEMQAVETPAKSVRAPWLGEDGFGVAAGLHGELLFTKDDGATWAFSPDWRTGGKNRRPNYLNGAVAVGSSHAWIVGDNGLVLRTTDAGKTVTEQHIGDGDWLTGVRFADKKHGWILGSHFVWRSEDGGKTWRKQPTAGGVNMYGLSVLDADTAWIAGHYGVIQHTTDGGKTWRTLNDYTDLYAVTMLDQKLGYAGAESGGILKTADGGRTWRFLPALRGSAVEALQFMDAGTGWAVGDYGHVAFTADGGETWKAGRLDFADILKDVHMFDARRGVVVGARGAVFLTSDGGASWTRAATPTRKMLYAVDFPTPRIGYACGDDVVLKTTDGGKTWSLLPSPSVDIHSDVRFLSETTGVMVGDVGQIFRTTDGGRTWKRVASPSRQWLHRIDVQKSDVLLVAGSRGTILRSPDGGKTWSAMPSDTVRNIYCISGRVAVGRWGTIQVLDPKAAPAAPPAKPAELGPPDLMPKAKWNPLPEPAPRGTYEIDDKGRLQSVTVSGRTYPTSGEFPELSVVRLEGGKPVEIKTLRADDKAWTITELKTAKTERTFLYDSDLLTVRVRYEDKPDRLVATVKVVKEKAGRLLSVSTGGNFLRLMGDTPQKLRSAALVVPVDGGERIPFSGLNYSNDVLQKWNHLHGWYFKNRMIGFADGKAGLILRSHQWHSLFVYGQNSVRQRPVAVKYLYLGLAFDMRLGGGGHVGSQIKKDGYKDGAPGWMLDPPPIDTFGFDIQYVGDVNGDGTANWVDVGMTYRDTNFPRSEMIDLAPAMCDTFNQTRVAWNWGYILWSTPFTGNTHSDVRAHKRRSDGRVALEWGDFSRSIAYETASGRMARYFDKQADECDFPPTPAHIGADTWTCGVGGSDQSEAHPGTAEESARAKVAVLRMLGRRGYLTHSEALSEWGMAGQYLWGWWTPYVGGGAWPLGFSRSWQYSPKASSGPQRSHAFSEAIPLQTVIFQGMCYWGSGHNGPPGFAILHGCRPNEGGSQGISDNAYFYFPWLVLWKTVSPQRVMNIRKLEPDLWELTYYDKSVLKIDVRANTWVYEKDGITYDGYSPPNPVRDAIRPAPKFTWGIPYDTYAKKYPKGSFGVWRNGTFTIRVPGIRAVRLARIAGTKDKDPKPPKYTTEFKDGVLHLTVENKDPKRHPMLIFEPVEGKEE